MLVLTAKQQTHNQWKWDKRLKSCFGALLKQPQIPEHFTKLSIQTRSVMVLLQAAASWVCLACRASHMFEPKSGFDLLIRGTTQTLLEGSTSIRATSLATVTLWQRHNHACSNCSMERLKGAAGASGPRSHTSFPAGRACMEWNIFRHLKWATWWKPCAQNQPCCDWTVQEQECMYSKEATHKCPFEIIKVWNIFSPSQEKIHRATLQQRSPVFTSRPSCWRTSLHCDAAAACVWPQGMYQVSTGLYLLNVNSRSEFKSYSSVSSHIIVLINGSSYKMFVTVNLERHPVVTVLLLLFL